MGFVKDAVKGVGKAVGGIPFLGDAVEIGTQFIPGVGPIVSSAIGAGRDLIGGEGNPDEAINRIQAARDAQRSRELMNEALASSRDASTFAIDQANRDQPLRQGFRAGAMSFADPTNPFGGGADFGRGLAMGSGMLTGGGGPPEVQPQAQPQPQGSVGGGGFGGLIPTRALSLMGLDDGQFREPQGPPPGSFAGRISRALGEGVAQTPDFNPGASVGVDRSAARDNQLRFRPRLR